jgi:site-specific DNA-methyltransferase (adenine-specific)
MAQNRIYLGSCEKILTRLPAEKFDMIYVDPPFNTMHEQRRGDLVYADSYGKEYLAWLGRCLKEAKRLLTPRGSLLVHLDQTSVYDVKCFILDFVFGKKNFMNEIIWAYDYGGRSKKCWPRKHDNILWYVKNPAEYIFNYDAVDRVPYMAPGLAGKEKAARGKFPTDVHWQTIVPTNGKEKTGYPTQKPLGLLNRLVLAHSNHNSWCLDFCAGSGSFGEACALHQRQFVLIDSNPDAIHIQSKRLEKYRVKIIFT